MRKQRTITFQPTEAVKELIAISVAVLPGRTASQILNECLEANLAVHVEAQLETAISTIKQSTARLRHFTQQPKRAQK
jgi:hypothetical protein